LSSGSVDFAAYTRMMPNFCINVCQMFHTAATTPMTPTIALPFITLALPPSASDTKPLAAVAMMMTGKSVAPVRAFSDSLPRISRAATTEASAKPTSVIEAASMWLGA
jgi:hypothetical protein